MGRGADSGARGHAVWGACAGADLGGGGARLLARRGECSLGCGAVKRNSWGAVWGAGDGAGALLRY